MAMIGKGMKTIAKNSLVSISKRFTIIPSFPDEIKPKEGDNQSTKIPNVQQSSNQLNEGKYSVFSDDSDCINDENDNDGKPRSPNQRDSQDQGRKISSKKNNDKKDSGIFDSPINDW